MKYIKFFDLFDIKFHFYINNQPNYQNFFGGIMSFIFYITCFLGFIIFSIDDLKKINPTSSKSEIPDAGLRTVNVFKEKIWIPFRMVTYEEQFVDHRGLLFPLIYYVEGKWDNLLGMDLKYHLLTYKLCNETSMANKPNSFKINVPLNELFCIDNDDLPFGGSWNGNYLHYLEYNLHLCEGGIHYNASDPRCTKIEDLLAHKSTSWLFEFYYPVVQFQPTNYEVPLAIIYKSYFYRLATHSNKVERIYISQHVLSDVKSIFHSKTKNSSCWGMSSLYGDDYYMEYLIDPLVKSTSSRLYSLDIYMDQGMIYYTRSYKNLFLIIADYFPILKLLLFIFKKSTQHLKISETKRKLAGLLFENEKINHKNRLSRKFERRSLGSLNFLENKLKIEKNNNNFFKNHFKKGNNSNENNSYIENSNTIYGFNTKKKFSKSNKSKNIIIFEQNNNILVKKNTESDKNNNSINKSNISLTNEKIIQVLNNQGITKLNSKKKENSIFLIKEPKLRESYIIQKKKNSKYNKGKELFPYFYFFLDIFFDKFKHPQRFCCIPKKYFKVYNFMGKVYDISTYIMIFKQFNILNKLIYENLKRINYIFPFEIKNKININNNYELEQLEKELKSKKCIIFTNTFLKY